MSDKIERYNALLTELKKATQAFDYARQDDKAETSAVSVIRELRQIIERLRRLVDDEQPPVEVHSLRDAMKLNRDELAFLVWQFFQWINSDEGCPADKCKDFPCKYRREQKEMCEENLKNGDLDEFGMKEQQENGFFAAFCEGDQQGCWAEYYLWCYRNGVNPLNGKKEVQQ